MKVLIISDLHADNYTQFARLLDNGVNSRLQACLDVLSQVHDICISKEISDIFFLGDLFNSRTAVPMDVYYLVYEKLKEISNDRDIWLLVGNHDLFLKRGNEISSTRPFETICHVVDKPMVTISVDNLTQFVWLPFEEGNKENLKLLRDFQPLSIRKNALLLGHLGLTGAKVGTHEYRMKTELNVEDLHPELFDWVVLGHYHKFQILGKDENVVYAGSMLQRTFGERGEKKSAFIFDTKNPHELSRIELTAPKFISRKATAVISFKTTAKLSVVRGNYVEVSCKDSERDGVNKKLMALGAKDFVIKGEFEEHFQPRLQVDSLASISDMVEAYVDGSETKLEKKKLKSIAKEIMGVKHNERA